MEFALGKKLYTKGCITLDGRMDEPVWDEAQEFTGFRSLKNVDGSLVSEQTSFKILPCEDRLYIGFRCEEPDMEYLLSHYQTDHIYVGDHVELFFSPSGDHSEFYQFFVTAANITTAFYYEEGGFIKPDPYHPIWNSAVHLGEDFWSCEIEIPLTAFYMTRDHMWRDTWLFNATRTRNRRGVAYTSGGCVNSSWSLMFMNFFEPEHFNRMGGFPKRAIVDDVYISSATADMTLKTETGYEGTMTVRVTSAVAGEYTFSTVYTDSVKISLQAGEDTITVPCAFEKEIRYPVTLSLTRLSDGVVISRVYPVLASYEPVKIRMTLPEYRNNFYPGQDYSKVMGKATAAKPITLKLEGPGIETQIVTPDENGNFCFDTANFEEGDAFLTATIDGAEVVKKIRRLPPSGHRMSWISGGNLIVDGKATVRRNIYSDGWRGGEIFRRKYAAEPQYQTPEVTATRGYMRIDVQMRGCDAANGEALKDIMPSDEMLRKIDAVMEDNKDCDFVYYYIADEPECRNVSHIYLKNLYEYIADKDPYHVISIASRGADRYVECADWFETHPYINPAITEDGTRIYGRPINTIGRYVDDISKLNRSDKCIGFLPTLYATKHISLRGDYPTLDEMICHCWAATVRGSKTLWPFYYADMPDRMAMYEGIRFVFSSHEALQKFILFGKRTTIINTPEVEATRFDCDDGSSMFVLLNKVETPQSVTVPGIEGTWCNFRQASDITTNTFDLYPFQVVIGTMEDYSGDLPTYRQIKAICDNHDYKRTHSKSLLYERTKDIEISASNQSRSFWKLFDGVRDNMGWDHPKGVRQKFLELGLTKVNPTFTKIVISGWRLHGVSLYTRENGELVPLEIADVKEDEFSISFTMPQATNIPCLRMEFPESEEVQVFEVELFA